MLELVEDLARQLEPLADKVYRPSEIEDMAMSAMPGERRGLQPLLSKHKGGVISIEQPRAVRADGLTSVYWVTVACLHSDPIKAERMAKLAIIELCGTPVNRGRARLSIPNVTLSPERGVAISRATYEFHLLDDVSAL